MQHEKYTSQLQLSIKALQAKVKEKQQLQSPEKSKGPVSKLQDRAKRRAQSLTGKQRCQHILHNSKYQQEGSRFYEYRSTLIVLVARKELFLLK